MEPTDGDAWRFLLGEWVGEGSGKPGQSEGGFSFSYELENKIIVRRSRADYPATDDRPAFSHQDLTVIYRGPQETARAIYFDNEGHVINYAVEFSDKLNGITFLSELIPGAPRYRLTYGYAAMAP